MNSICAPAMAAMFLFLFSGEEGYCGPNAMPKPQDCSKNKYFDKLNEFSNKNGEEECKVNNPASCDRFKNSEDAQEGTPSICKSIYRKIQRSVKRYSEEIKRRCTLANTELKTCEGRPRGKVQAECLRNFLNLQKRDEMEMATDFKKVQERLVKLESQAKSVREKYQVNRNGYSQVSGPGLGARDFGINSHTKLDLKCIAMNDNERLAGYIFDSVPDVPNSEGRLIDEQNAAIKFAETFRQLAYDTAKSHEDKAEEFGRQAAVLDKVATNASSVDDLKQPPPGNKSDVSGASQKPTGETGGAPGGGAPSGGSGGPEGGASDQGAGGATAGTPPSLNNSSTLKPGNEEANKTRNSGAGNPSNDKNSASFGKAGQFSSPGGLALGDEKSTSRQPAGGRSSNGSKPASGHASGGDGGVGSSGGSPCIGADCSQALGNMKASQFASVGSLGGGGGLGMDGSAPLESLFGAPEESKQDAAAAGPDALSEFAAAEEGAQALDSGSEQAGGEIGTAEGHDLFMRVHVSYWRIQKRGGLVGMPKKL